jgi:hypothetical protein
MRCVSLRRYLNEVGCGETQHLFRALTAKIRIRGFQRSAEQAQIAVKIATLKYSTTTCVGVQNVKC